MHFYCCTLLNLTFNIVIELVSCIRNGTFCLNSHIFRGGHGDIYRARQIRGGHEDTSSSFILKRMHILDRPNIELCAKREIYFGESLLDTHHTARYLSYFKTTTDYWLVFRDEGMSLQQVPYFDLVVLCCVMLCCVVFILNVSSLIALPS